MVKYYPTLSEDHRDWCLRQQVFFIASAPLIGEHVNLSPKGLPAATLAVFDENHAAYIDATGSGIETVSHVHENGRATVMFCSFDRSPRIMRWFCRGRVVEWNTPEFASTLKRMGKKEFDCARAVIMLEIFKVQTSCGFAVPLISQRIDPADIQLGPKGYMQDRGTLGRFAKDTKERGLMEWYHQQANIRSLDGCGGLRAARQGKGENMLLEDTKIWLRRVFRQWEAMLIGAVLMLLTVGLVMPLLSFLMSYTGAIAVKL